MNYQYSSQTARDHAWRRASSLSLAFRSGMKAILALLVFASVLGLQNEKKKKLTPSGAKVGSVCVAY